MFNRIRRNSVSVLEKLRKYEEAVDLITDLLDNSSIHPKHRGELWERKIIDCERHLKHLEKVKNAVS